ncbi:response regulator transcription factor [Desulforamulus aquiferis]|uniref:Stage 0 sporulation protein A homolog n=1 Tax=Desulforamulus aquiferis TaxID=1397668 RepID=A0AAW7Z9A5_9FIRM|nr:response regulator transcription factor [Desulforamulus aquiferis]MDO7785906.1 response regulator transcription factor [Desulforamulus aquiferis]RYD02127.1 transcriptional regulator [Desulforamulus aquiferis]
MKHILIIEDDLHIAELERDYLQLNGYKVDICQNGEIGLQKVLDGGYDIIIVDLMLPGIDGYEIVREIRRNLEVPVIIVSAKSEDIDKIRGLGFGADDYLTKPFSSAELVARVKSHIQRYERLMGKKASVEIISHRGLEINTSSHKVLVNGREIILTTKEYELLLFLASNPNIVFSKEKLFEKIWGEDYFGEPATVAVHIQKVRKKIEPNPADPQYIETLWGTGYRFNA